MPAITVPLTAPYDLVGTTEAQHPELSGPVIVDSVDDIVFYNDPMKLKLQSRLVRSSKTGKLDCYFRVFNNGLVPGYIKYAEIAYLLDLGASATFADYRIDSTGTIAPTQVLQTPPPDALTSPTIKPFYFIFNQTIPPGASTHFFFISTNAVEHEQYPHGSFAFQGDTINHRRGIHFLRPKIT